MSAYPQLQQTFVCLNPWEKEAVRGCTLLFTPPSFFTVWTAYEVVLFAAMPSAPAERMDAFGAMWGVTRVEVPGAPFPFDVLAEFDPAIWSDVWQFVVIEGAPYEDGCAYSNWDVDHNGLSRPLGT